MLCFLKHCDKFFLLKVNLILYYINGTRPFFKHKAVRKPSAEKLLI